MKELSIEEKAERYDEALEKAKIWQNHLFECGDKDYAEELSYIFSELKEREDEMSKKWILEYLYDGLRKSDEQFKGHFKTAIAWLEKQGEQKPLIEMKSPEESLGISAKEYNEIVNDSLYGESKSADKVEPKFHEGDWVVSEVTGSVYQIKHPIENLKTHKYGYELTNDGYISSTETNHYHLWTIQDAEDGDLIYFSTKAKGVQAIFHKFENDIIYFHCNLCSDFTQGGYEQFYGVEFVCPLQKTHYQRFFQKMHEAGYEFDFDRKKLKKIE